LRSSRALLRLRTMGRGSGIDRWEQLLFESFTDAALCDAKGAAELAWDFEADLSTRVDADGIQLTAKQIRTYMGKQDYVYGFIGLAPD
jgi:hypothetical protein